jgi:hypothetical protein
MFQSTCNVHLLMRWVVNVGCYLALCRLGLSLTDLPSL